VVPRLWSLVSSLWSLCSDTPERILATGRFAAALNHPSHRRIAELDGLRGIAIALVLWHHLVHPYLPPVTEHWLGGLRAAGNMSWCGVELFFVLSGFFIGGILIDHRDSPRLGKVFYLRRALRILPLYFLTLIICLAAARTGWSGRGPDFGPWVYALFLQNLALAVQNHWEVLAFSILWSLAVEEQFYLIAPWVVRWISPARLPVVLAALILTAMLLRSALQWHLPGREIGFHVLTPLRMDSLALGALLAWAVRAPAARPFFVRLQTTWSLWLAGALALVTMLALSRPVQGGPLLVHLGYSLINVCFGLLVAIVVAVRPAGLNRLLALAPLAHLGRHSYFIYLWHVLIGWSIIQWLGGSGFFLKTLAGAGLVLLAVSATWLAAIVSWKYFESPLLRLAHRTGY
jgi:peptidoglycan/LPS O-acetylase OafA/YrhL